MNYRHSYHAGNPADVIKHSILVLLIQALKQKEKGFCYIDSHAGRGIYDLTGVEAKKTHESNAGIKHVYRQLSDPLFTDYQQIIADLNPSDELIYYPGSPWIAFSQLRSQDSLILNELHPEESTLLKRLFRRTASPAHPTVSIHQRDAYEFLPAVVPPTLRRGLVLIDPPYERRDELSQLVAMMEKCYPKWSEATYLFWLPLKEVSLTNFHQRLRQITKKEIFHTHVYWESAEEESTKMQGCSIVIINLPWYAEQKIQPLLSALRAFFGS